MLLWLIQRIAVDTSEENAIAALVQRLKQEDVTIAQAATYIKMRRLKIADYLTQITAAPALDAYLMGTGLDQIKAWELCKETAKKNPEILPESLRGGY